MIEPSVVAFFFLAESKGGREHGINRQRQTMRTPWVYLSGGRDQQLLQLVLPDHAERKCL